MFQYLAFHTHLSQGQHTVMVYKSVWLSKRALSGVIISLLTLSFCQACCCSSETKTRDSQLLPLLKYSLIYTQDAFLFWSWINKVACASSPFSFSFVGSCIFHLDLSCTDAFLMSVYQLLSTDGHPATSLTAVRKVQGVPKIQCE